MENLSQADKMMLEFTPNKLNQDPVEPVAPVEPVEPVEPVDPIDPSDPLEPIDPVEPDPVDPVEPVDPVDNDPVIIEDWDLEDLEDPAVATDPVFDYSALSQEVGIEANTKEDLVSKLNAIKDEYSIILSICPPVSLSFLSTSSAKVLVTLENIVLVKYDLSSSAPIS